MFKNKIFNKLLISTLAPVIIIILLFFSLNQVKESKTKIINKNISKFQELIITVYKMNISIADFVDFDRKEEFFYKENTTESIKEFNLNRDKSLKTIGEIISNSNISIEVKNDAHKIRHTILELDKTFHSLTKIQLALGFKNWGLIGLWRSKIHTLEDLILNQRDDKIIAKMLMMRRHEKDYLLRGQTKYIEHMKKRENEASLYLKRSNIRNKNLMINYIKEYHELFNKYVEKTKQLNKFLHTQSNLTVQLTDHTVNAAKHTVRELNRHNSLFTKITYALLVLSVIIGLLISYIFSKFLTRPIYKLIELIKVTPGDQIESLKEINSTDEVNTLRDTIIDKTLESESDKKLLESQSQMSTVGEVSANIAHEIYNPISVITSYIKIIKKKKRVNDHYVLDDKDLERLEKSSSNIVNIVESIKKISKANSYKDFNEFNLKEIFRPIQYLLQNRLKISNINLTIEEIQDDVLIKGNESLLSQVLVNLINNSRQAIIEEDDKWILVKTHITENQVCIKVIDSGRGIPDVIKNKLFNERFTTKAGNEGTGLGLPLCKKIIEEHKGNIYIEENTKNTTFVIEIPRLEN